MSQDVLYDNGLKKRYAVDSSAAQKLSSERLLTVKERILPEAIRRLKGEGIAVDLTVVGSTANGTATPESDVDLVMTVTSNGKGNEVSYGRVRGVLSDLRDEHHLPYYFHVHQPGENTTLQMDMFTKLQGLKHLRGK